MKNFRNKLGESTKSEVMSLSRAFDNVVGQVWYLARMEVRVLSQFPVENVVLDQIKWPLEEQLYE